MFGDLIRLAVGEAATHVRGWAAAAALLVVMALAFVVALAFATTAAYVGLLPELGAAWTPAVIGAAYLGVALVALAANAMVRRRRLVRKLGAARASAPAPAVSPEMLLVAAAAGALFSLGADRRAR